MIILNPKDRRDLILERLNMDKKIDVDQLADQLNVSTMTIRRDLNGLESEGKVIRTYGGAVLNKPLVKESSFQVKETKFSAQKQRIAQTAIEIIPENSTILLDSGTTTYEIAKLLKNRRNITVITNDIKIAAELMNSELKVIIAGGELQNNIGALFGPLTEHTIKNIHVDLLFLGTHAVDPEAGLTSTTFEKAYIKKLMIEAAETTWLVTDSSKFGQKSFAKICDLSNINGVITDEGITEEYKEKIREYLKVIIPRRNEK
ncbi:DeoR/GlpR family DNA-binding transcription regulator [Pseudogracilibacillus sp. SO30301A]|uniref:DeoR/GlpR family DNA-binding transcription regulator n=1 Tax=Pseudogracilibacillus sp. SO30301A TaxID=3098291 RepID=UPI003FA757AC